MPTTAQQRLLKLFLGPAIAFGIASLVVLVGPRLLPREAVGPLAVALGLGISSYVAPAAGRRRNLLFSVALGGLAALTLFLAFRYFGLSR
jgi:hypothetical protein